MIIAGGYSIITTQRKVRHYFEIFHPFKPSKPTKLKISQHNKILKSFFLLLLHQSLLNYLYLLGVWYSADSSFNLCDRERPFLECRMLL